MSSITRQFAILGEIICRHTDQLTGGGQQTTHFWRQKTKHMLPLPNHVQPRLIKH